jgi:tetratricopeptide (TPR) repeat protein
MTTDETRLEYLTKAYELLKDDNTDMTKIAEGMKVVDELLRKNPYNRDALNYKGMALARMGNAKEAMLCLNHVIKQFPTYWNGYLNKGRILLDSNPPQYAEALILFNKAIELQPTDDYGHFNKAFTLCELGEYKEAIKSYDKALELNPKDGFTHYNKGNCLIQMENFKSALESYNKAELLKPNDWDIHFNKGNCLSTLKNFEEALKSYNKALQCDAGSSCTKEKADFLKGNCLMEKANCLRELNESKMAIKEYLAAGLLDPFNFVCYSNIGEILYMDLGKHEAAIAYFNKSIEINPNEHGQFINKANCLLKCNKFKEAIDCYDQALKVTKENIDLEVNFNKCIAFSKLENKCEQALECIDKCLKIEPSKQSFLNVKMKILESQSIGLVKEINLNK